MAQMNSLDRDVRNQCSSRSLRECADGAAEALLDLREDVRTCPEVTAGAQKTAET